MPSRAIFSYQIFATTRICNISALRKKNCEHSSKVSNTHNNSRSCNHSSDTFEINSCKSITHILYVNLQKRSSPWSVNSHRFRIAHFTYPRQSGPRLLWINRAIFYDEYLSQGKREEDGRRIYLKSPNPLIHQLNGAARMPVPSLAFLCIGEYVSRATVWFTARVGKCHQVIQNR